MRSGMPMICMPASTLPIPDDIEFLHLVAAQRAELDAERAARVQAEAAHIGRDLT
jgi:hypothetical protein